MFEAPFLERAARLPKLGLGVSTEYGARAASGGLDPLDLRARHPRWGGFLELGIEVEKGLDPDAERWLAAGLPTTYHFLDVNLDEPEDLDPAWVAAVRGFIDRARPAWLCGDAGLWHYGPRERGQMLLLPPILREESARAMATGIRALRGATGREVFPENPPGSVFVGELGLLDWFARLAEAADTGVLLDIAHLAIYQHYMGRDALDDLADFPAERVIEVHIAGGVERVTRGFSWIEDVHGGAVLPAVWRILDALLPRMTNLKAVILECERNTIEDVAPMFAETERRLGGWV